MLCFQPLSLPSNEFVSVKVIVLQMISRASSSHKTRKGSGYAGNSIAKTPPGRNDS
jgi:hypothetical protein